MVERLTLALLLTLVTSACQTTSCWVRTEVYFGLSVPDGSQISAGDFQKFVDEVITPIFPDGLSIVDATGQWRNTAGHIDHEPSKVLVLLHPPGAEVQAKIDAIRKEYCRRFKQEVVMKVTSPAQVDF